MSRRFSTRAARAATGRAKSPRCPGTTGVIHHAGLYVIDKLPDGARLVNGKILGADGKEMSRNQVARANGASATLARRSNS